VLGARHAEALDAAIDPASDAPAQLVSYIEVHLGLGAHADPKALACWVLATAEGLRERRVRLEVERVLADLVARASAIIELGNRKGDFDCDDPASAASALVAVIQGYFNVAATDRALIPSGSAAPCVLKMTEGLVRPTRPLRRKGGKR
jgi:hypothetical protein